MMFGHSWHYWWRYALIIVVLSVTFDQLERVLLKDVV